MFLEPRQLLLVAAGGALGATLRFVSVAAIAHVTEARWGGIHLGTMAVNVVGSLLLGLLVFHGLVRDPTNVALLSFLGVGVLGAFTTMSSLSVETIAAWAEGHVWSGALNAVLNLVLSITAAATGRWVALAMHAG